MSSLHAAVAAIRAAVRAGCRDLAPGSLVLVACSGGVDSLALAATTAFVAPRMGLRAGLVTVDHNLQLGSAGRAGALVEWAGNAGLDPAIVKAVDVAPAGDGPEAAARAARYGALAEAAADERAAAVLLAHTRDDQAETVLLALARGSGPRGMAGMPSQRRMHGAWFLRPLLGVSRDQTHAACAELKLTPWSDPHNEDARFTRSRLRAAMPVLTDALGGGVVANLARTAGLVAADTEFLDGLAREAYEQACDAFGGLLVSRVKTLAAPIRTRVLRLFALGVGAEPGALSHVHVVALDALVVAWQGQGAVGLPGGFDVARRGDRLVTVRDIL